MAKLSNIKQTTERKPLPTSFEGMYVQNLSLKQMSDEFGNLEDALKEDHEGTITKVFVELLCDENGESFEDCQTWEEISAMFSLSNLNKIVQEAFAAVYPTVKN